MSNPTLKVIAGDNECGQAMGVVTNMARVGEAIPDQFCKMLFKREGGGTNPCSKNNEFLAFWLKIDKEWTKKVLPK